MRGMLFLFLLAQMAYAQQVFTEVSGEMGITGQTGLGHAVGWCDIDNDGDLDLAFSNQDGSGFWLYRNDTDQFTDITASAGLSGLGAGRILWGEMNGDAFSELVLARGSSPSIFRNNGDGTFTDISSGSGLSGTPACVADFNLDGSLDVFTMTSQGCQVLHNSGSGVFTFGPSATGDWWSAAVIDYDLDMDPDVYLGSYGSGANTLLRNDGESLVDVTDAAGVQFSGSTAGITVGDYNNDGNPDLYLANNSSPGCKLFSNQGDGTFLDVTTAAGVTGYSDTRTAGFTDFNNDGWLDIFVSHHDFYLYSNLMWKNAGDGIFDEVGSELGLSGEFIGDYFGTAWGDYNLDGNVDLFAVGHIDKYVLFRNDQSETIPSNYLTVELQGTDSNRNAVGAVVSAHFGPSSLYRWVGGCEGYHDFHSFPLEFGLYDAGMVETLEIHWPSGLVETYSDISVNQRITVVEGEGYSSAHASSKLQEENLGISLLPNPCRGSVSVICSGGPGEVCVFDCSGRLVENVGVSGGGSSDAVYWNPQEHAGVYLVRYSTPSAQATGKLVVLP